MAKEKPKSFPMLPVGHWWSLREKFKQTIPGVVTDNYLATALNIKRRSARANVLPYLRDIGLIDDQGKIQELAKEWRDDNQYPEVCTKIRTQIYPEELIASVPDPAEDRNAVERWFANHTGAGITAVKRMAAIYVVISDADISKRPNMRAKKETITAKKKTPAKMGKKPLAAATPLATAQAPPASAPPFAPGLNINLEIHISSDSTPDQIDKIFESMAKHIYKK